MSTRAQVIIKDRYDSLWFYRHSDGYPKGVTDTLFEFLDKVKSGQYRNNASQSAGWLILIGHIEYGGLSDLPFDGWKVGAYEPCTPILHGDTEYLYTIDLETLKITCKDIYGKKQYTLEKETANA